MRLWLTCGNSAQWTYRTTFYDSKSIVQARSIQDVKNNTDLWQLPIAKISHDFHSGDRAFPRRMGAVCSAIINAGKKPRSLFQDLLSALRSQVAHEVEQIQRILTPFGDFSRESTLIAVKAKTCFDLGYVDPSILSCESKNSHCVGITEVS